MPSLFLYRISVVRVYLSIAATTQDPAGWDPHQGTLVLSSPENHKYRSAISNVGEWREASTVHFHFFSIFSASHLLDIWNEIKRHKDICIPKFSWLMAFFSSGETSDMQKILPPSGILSSRKIPPRMEKWLPVTWMEWWRMGVFAFLTWLALFLCSLGLE